MMKTKERIKLLSGVMHEVYCLMQEVDSIVKGTEHEAHFKAYGKYGFNQLIGDGNPHDTSLQDIISDWEEELD